MSLIRSRLPFGLSTLLALVLLSGWALAQVQTPLVTINGKFRLVELARNQRATLTYDLRPIGGQHLAVAVLPHDAPPNSEPVKTWLFDGAYGNVRISFDDLPISVYTVLAFASNAQGDPVAGHAPLIHVQYGGWKAWEAFQPPVEKATEPPPSFEDVEVAVSRRNQDVGISVVPMASVVRPGEEVLLRADFRNLEPEKLAWTLDGEGQLEAVDVNVYRYRAPADQKGAKMFRVQIQSVSDPELRGGASILVTDFSPDDIMR